MHRDNFGLKSFQEEQQLLHSKDRLETTSRGQKSSKKMLKTEMEGRELKIPKKSSIFHQKNIGTQKNGLMISSKGEFLIFVSKKNAK